MKSGHLFPGKALPLTLFPILFLGFLSLHGNGQTDSIRDRQGNSYKIVAIGDQSWMAENLRVTQYANGDEIPHITMDTAWASTQAGAYCYYENKLENADIFGNLYNWYTIHDARGVCPDGWHVPADREWMTLEKYLGMSASEAGRMTAWRGTVEGDKLKEIGFGGNNFSGFSATGTGYRDPQGIFKAQGTDNDYWTSTAYSDNNSLDGILHGFLNTKSTVVRNFHDPGYGFCVRCIKDKVTDVSEISEIDNILVFPNPSKRMLYMRNTGGDSFSITNILGNTMLKGEIMGSIQQIDISGLEPGAYILSIAGSKDMVTRKFIKE